jgi:HEAT repeat protein
MGFTEEKRLVQYRGHRSLASFLGSKDPQKFAHLECFRSDDDLVTMLTWARENPQSVTANVLSKLVGVMRKIPVTRTNGKAQAMLLQWIETLTSDVLHTEGGLNESKLRILSSILRLTENLVPRVEFTDRFEAALKAAMEIKDRRVIANALESLTLFRKEYEPSLSARLARHPDNRVAANALLHEGLRQISPFVIKRLEKMLGSRNVANVASALYAMGEISSFHREQDSVYYGTQIEFLKLVKWIPALAANEDAMVRRQALIAARKCGDDDVVDSICRSVTERGDAGRLVEVRTYLGERHTQTKAG